MTSSAGWSSLSDRASSLRATGASMPLSPTLETVEEKANNLSRNAALRDFGNAIRSPLKLGAFPTPSNVQSSSLERTHRLLDRLDPGVAEAAALLDGAREQRSMDCVQVGDLDTSALLLSAIESAVPPTAYMLSAAFEQKWSSQKSKYIEKFFGRALRASEVEAYRDVARPSRAGASSILPSGKVAARPLPVLPAGYADAVLAFVKKQKCASEFAGMLRVCYEKIEKTGRGEYSPQVRRLWDVVDTLARGIEGRGRATDLTNPERRELCRRATTYLQQVIWAKMKERTARDRDIARLQGKVADDAIVKAYFRLLEAQVRGDYSPAGSKEEIYCWLAVSAGRWGAAKKLAAEDDALRTKIATVERLLSDEWRSTPTGTPPGMTQEKPSPLQRLFDNIITGNLSADHARDLYKYTELTAQASPIKSWQEYLLAVLLSLLCQLSDTTSHKPAATLVEKVARSMKPTFDELDPVERIMGQLLTQQFDQALETLWGEGALFGIQRGVDLFDEFSREYIDASHLSVALVITGLSRNETRAKDIIRAYVYNLWQAEAKAAALAYLSLCPDEDYSFLQDTFSRLLCSRGNSQEQIQPLVGGIDSYGRRTPALLDELLGDRAASTLQAVADKVEIMGSIDIAIILNDLCGNFANALRLLCEVVVMKWKDCAQVEEARTFFEKERERIEVRIAEARFRELAIEHARQTAATIGKGLTFISLCEQQRWFDAYEDLAYLDLMVPTSASLESALDFNDLSQQTLQPLREAAICAFAALATALVEDPTLSRCLIESHLEPKTRLAERAEGLMRFIGRTERRISYHAANEASRALALLQR